ncbi:MAG: hypothetical protein K2Y71_27035 [Xanthobacteraceae bacterium]|nr:hypothetical protein [Xanthobacteraceae bacterium]
MKKSVVMLVGMISVLAAMAPAQAGARTVQADGAYQLASWWPAPPRPPRAAVAAVRG